MRGKNVITAALVSAATALGSIWGYGEYMSHQPVTSKNAVLSGLFKHASVTGGDAGPMVDFERAATKAAPAVVHIKVSATPRQVSQGPGSQGSPFDDFFGDFFGEQQRSTPAPQKRGSGSGVVISADGYIVTNNHVVDEADEISVTLNNKKDYKAKLIGKDPSSDLAVIKIEASGLDYLSFANSDDVHLGQWVLAIGYPLGLETTVTSGIVSAKSRSLGINSRQSNSPVESFIQTDAAVNPGNSGGALVNTEGNVIGINSAIASPTGSYAGYSYAIPSNLVKKIVADIMEFGSTKRAYLGVMYGSGQMSEEDKKKYNVTDGDGVFVLDVAKGSAADKAGVQKGDFITKINGHVINSGTQMVEKIASHRPGDKITITYNHNGSEKTGSAVLQGESGTYDLAREQIVEKLGASFQDMDSDKAKQLGIGSGVLLKNLGAGILTEQTRIREGFIITKVNGSEVATVAQLKEALKNAGNSAVIAGVYAGQPQREYRYALNFE